MVSFVVDYTIVDFSCLVYVFYSLLLPYLRHRVDAMTKYDSLLYYNGLVRFIQEFDDVGFKHNVSISDFHGNMEPLYVTIDLVKKEFGNMKYISWIKGKLAGVKNVPH